MADVDPTQVRWWRSSYSGANGNCIEIGDFGDLVGIRDSEDPSGPIILLTRAEWRAFLAAVRDGALRREDR
jgi:Domain of unknown function (DUF397)